MPRAPADPVELSSLFVLADQQLGFMRNIGREETGESRPSLEADIQKYCIRPPPFCQFLPFPR